MLCLCLDRRQDPSEKYSFVVFVCHGGSALETSLCLVGDHDECMSMLLA